MTSLKERPAGAWTPGAALRRAGRVEEFGVLAALAALIGVIGVFHPDFLYRDQLIDVVRQASYIGVMACAMTFLLAMRELDLSVGSTYALSMIFAAILMREGVSPWIAAGAGLAAGVVLGAVNGALCNLVGIPSIIATLGTLSVFRGAALALSDGRQVAGLPRTDSFFQVMGGDILGVPTAIWCLVAVAAVLTVVLRATPFGYRVRAIGSNPDAARFSGISIPRTRLQVLMLSGGLAAVGGMLTLGFFASGQPTVGQGYELSAIAAAVIGGTPLRGGSGTVAGSVLGTLILGAVATGLVYFAVPINWSLFATGVVILLAVALDGLLRRRRTARAAT